MSARTIEIRHRSTRAVLWRGEAESVREAVAKAVAAGADLRGANLVGANLRDADLRDANLRGADPGAECLNGQHLEQRMNLPGSAGPRSRRARARGRRAEARPVIGELPNVAEILDELVAALNDQARPGHRLRRAVNVEARLPSREQNPLQLRGLGFRRGRNVGEPHGRKAAGVELLAQPCMQ